jgi:G3E family GTPase
MTGCWASDERTPMAEPLDDLRQRWAEEARERAELDAVVDVVDDDELLD